MKDKEDLELKEELAAYDFSQEQYTYQDLLNINDGKRYEIIDGYLFEMYSPSVKHQMFLGEIYRQIANCLKGKECKAFASPLDVRLFFEENSDDKIYNVVQPDILIICNKDKIDKKGIIGSPDFILEIVSENNKAHDVHRKFNLYQKYKVREYWVLYPEEQIIMPYILNDDGIYMLPQMYKTDEDVKINILENLTISLKDFIQENEYILKK